KIELLLEEIQLVTLQSQALVDLKYSGSVRINLIDSAQNIAQVEKNKYIAPDSNQ
ncbi:17172_t:CDS:1, partial [Racocetra persica]